MKALLAVMLASTALALPDDVTSMVVLDFLPIALSGTDRETYERYIANPVNAQCNSVSFESERLSQLIADLNAGRLSIEESVVFVRLPAADPLSFVGTVFEGVDKHGERGPFLWEGRLEGSSEYFASLVIETSGRTRAYFTASAGMFRLAPAQTPQAYFLCQRDPEFQQDRAGR